MKSWKGMEWVLGPGSSSLWRLVHRSLSGYPAAPGCDCKLVKLIPEPPMKQVSFCGHA